MTRRDDAFARSVAAVATEHEFGQLCAEAVSRWSHPTCQTWPGISGGRSRQWTTSGSGLAWRAWCQQQNEAARPTGAHKRSCDSQRR
jgi:hypothetical protein